MIFNHSICTALSFVLLLQTAGCYSVRSLSTLNETEIGQYKPDEGVFVRLILKPESDLPFNERNITCRIVKIDQGMILIKSVGVPMIDFRKVFEVKISDIRKMEILERKFSGAKTGALVALLAAILLAIGSQVEVDLPRGPWVQHQ